MSTEDCDICCNLTPLYEVEPEDDSFMCDMFSIEVVANFTFLPDTMEEEEDDESRIYSLDSEEHQEKFLVERDQLLLYDQETSRSIIHDILVNMNIPIQPFVIDRILDCAHQMGRDKRFVGSKVLAMRVNIDVISGNMNGDGHSDVDVDIDDDDSVLNLVPATKSSIEALEIVKVEDSAKQCMVCLEEILIGLEATRLPCSHLYHCQCICNWLETNRLCPLCRFEIA